MNRLTFTEITSYLTGKPEPNNALARTGYMLLEHSSWGSPSHFNNHHNGNVKRGFLPVFISCLGYLS